jgi:hypothetical protein
MLRDEATRAFRRQSFIACGSGTSMWLNSQHRFKWPNKIPRCSSLIPDLEKSWRDQNNQLIKTALRLADISHATSKVLQSQVPCSATN